MHFLWLDAARTETEEESAPPTIGRVWFGCCCFATVQETTDRYDNDDK